MRLLLLVLALVLTLMYFTFGVRLGYLTLTPTYLLNATGENRYTFQVYDQGGTVGVRGSCKVRSGKATFRLTDPSGTQVAGQICPQGQWSLNVLGGGDAGMYHLTVELDKFTGTIDVEEARK
ncbi:hypothetical protein [Deinococcus aerophilus]|uniref:Uncharacterized protein n=1 Tax=Deinococcus aerophilus TaxID=522488 RepID=A0ABQ2GPB5_9DEIO|nr:hypothetical protein [Deinococcus aerophilus]GGM06559.1 hypothetical protein GCM10010841_13490 [Deinococcus aerophilus]